MTIVYPKYMHNHLKNNRVRPARLTAFYRDVGGNSRSGIEHHKMRVKLLEYKFIFL